MLFDRNIHMFIKKIFAQCPFATNSEHLYNSEHLSKSKEYRVYSTVLCICPHLPIQNPRSKFKRECFTF